MLKQRLLVEFSGLQHACPQGVFMSLAPGDAALWSGVIFVREGPYAPAILRFQVSFPPEYPSLPPLVTFYTDIFHPLITPLSTLTYTTDIQDSGTVSATDEERLPPGGFSLRHGFPRWFGRASRSAVSSRKTSAHYPPPAVTPAGDDVTDARGRETPESVASSSPNGRRKVATPHVSTYEVLRYIRSTFDDESVLDSIPLEAAGNTGAWHAWRTYRPNSGIQPTGAEGAGDGANRGSERNEGVSSDPSTPTTRTPADWNWDGVWEVRSKKGIEASLAEPTLYGNLATSDELIRFLNLDVDQLDTVKENLMRSLESV
ncbi:MAG: hypothetical protein M1818_007764 [Claussenomyces sp. TS43310]|nr:MAG: hypothetical protein M1818_007764 [Claussenomyces sp. TS43310]